MDYLQYAQKKMNEVAVECGGDREASIKRVLELAESDDALRTGLTQAGLAVMATGPTQ